MIAGEMRAESLEHKMRIQFDRGDDADDDDDGMIVWSRVGCRFLTSSRLR